MAPTQGRRRRDKGKSKARKRKEAHRGTTVHDLPEHVFGQILLRLGPNSPSLLRVAAACKRWCRIVGDAGFLARIATTATWHVGDYRTIKGCPLFFPSMPLEVDGHRLSLDFLHDSTSWVLADSRGSVLLLEKKFNCGGTSHYRCGCCPDLIVCDPLTTRYQGILWPPDLDGLNRMGVFLSDGDDGAGCHVSLSNFRIVAAVEETLVLVFTAGSDGGWGMKTALYMVLVLDEATAVFSLDRLPQNVWGLPDEDTAWLIGGEDGVLRAVRLIGNDLNVFVQRHPGCSNDDEWVLEKQLDLLEATTGLPGHDEALFDQEVFFHAANGKCIVLSLSDQTWVFSVDLDTMRVKPETYIEQIYPYELPWPPVLPDVSKKGRQ
ncbi:hypothetical protein ACQ4PT_071724 [Festuca glaucescens]